MDHRLSPGSTVRASGGGKAPGARPGVVGVNAAGVIPVGGGAGAGAGGGVVTAGAGAGGGVVTAGDGPVTGGGVAASGATVVPAAGATVLAVPGATVVTAPGATVGPPAVVPPLVFPRPVISDRMPMTKPTARTTTSAATTTMRRPRNDALAEDLAPLAASARLSAWLRARRSSHSSWCIRLTRSSGVTCAAGLALSGWCLHHRGRRPLATHGG